jgi:hypothetical protein
MRKTLLISFMAGLLFSGTALFGQTTWTTNGVLQGKHTLSASLGMVSAGGVEEGKAPFGLSYHFEVPSTALSAGVQFNKDTTDLTFNGVYFPLNTAHIRLGAGALYHAGWLTDTLFDTGLISFQSDFFVGAYATVNFWLLYLNANVAWFEQIITVPSLPKDYRNFGQSDLALSIFLGARLLDNLSAEIGVSSYEMYRYNLFFNPAFSFAARYQFQSTLFAGRLFAAFSTTVRYSDMFTLSGHVINTVTTFSAGYSF